jgi:hypothetical protein
MEVKKNIRAEYMKSCCWKGAYTPGQETQVTPDVVDAVDADYILQGLGVYGLRRPRRVRRV